MFINELKILYYLWTPTQKIMKKFTLFAVFTILCASSFAQKIQFSDPINVLSSLDSTVGC